MDEEDIIGRKIKNKSLLSHKTALHKATLEALKDLDLSTQIYSPILFKTYGPHVKIDSKQYKRRNQIPKPSIPPEDKIVFFETSVGLGKPLSSKIVQYYQGKPPLKLGPSRKLSISPTMMEKLDISLVKPITSFGIDQVFVPSPIKNVKIKTFKTKRRKRGRTKRFELQTTKDKQISKVISATEHEESIPSSLGEKKYICKKIIRTLKEHIKKKKNISKVKVKVDSDHIKESRDLLSSEENEIFPQKKTLKLTEHEFKSIDIKTSELLKSNTCISAITAEFFKSGDGQHAMKASEKINIEAEAFSIQSKDLQKLGTAFSDKTVKIPDSVSNEETKKLKSKIKKEIIIQPCANEIQQKTSESKPKNSETKNIEGSSGETSRPSHMRKQITPQKNKSPGLKLLTLISETNRNDSKGSYELFDQPVWDYTARPRFSIQLQPVSLEGTKSETKILDTSTFTCLPQVSPQQVFVKIQTTETKPCRPSLNVEMQTVSSEVTILMDKSEPPLSKSRSIKMIPSDTNKKTNSKKRFKTLQETKEIALTKKLEKQDSKLIQQPRPSYSTQSKISKPYKLSYEEITPPEIMKAILAKESQVQVPKKDDYGQPILRLRLNQNLPEPRPRENVVKSKPEKRKTRSKISWKNVSYVVDSFKEPEEYSATEKLRKLLPSPKKHNAKLRKIQNQTETENPQLEFVPSEPKDSENIDTSIKGKKETIKPGKLSCNQPESSEKSKLTQQSDSNENRTLVSTSSKSKKQNKKSKKLSLTQSEATKCFELTSALPETSEIRKLKLIKSEPKNAQPDVIEIQDKNRKIKSSSELNKQAIRIRSTSPDQKPSRNRRPASPSPGPRRICRSATFTREPAVSCKLAPSVPASSGVYKPTSPTPWPNKISKPCVNRRPDSPMPRPSRIRKVRSPVPRSKDFFQFASPIPEPNEIFKSLSPTPEFNDIQNIETHLSKYKEKILKYKKSPFSQSESSSSPKSLSPPRGIYDKSKFSLPRIKRRTKLRKSRYTKFESSGIQNSPYIQSESSDSQKSISSTQKLSNMRKIESILLNQNVMPKSSNQTDPNWGQKLKSSPQKTCQKTPAPDPKKNNNSATSSSVLNKGPLVPVSSDLNVTSKIAPLPVLLSVVHKFKNDPADPNSILEKLPFPPSEPTGFSKLSRNIKYLEKQNALYDEHGIHIESGKDVCDCLIPNCQGCFNPCLKCRSKKCGLECRVNRKYVLDEAVFEDSNTIYKFENCL